MKTLGESNRELLEDLKGLRGVLAGVACDHCVGEMIFYHQVMGIVICPECGFNGLKLELPKQKERRR